MKKFLLPIIFLVNTCIGNSIKANDYIFLRGVGGEQGYEIWGQDIDGANTLLNMLEPKNSWAKRFRDSSISGALVDHYNGTVAFQVTEWDTYAWLGTGNTQEDTYTVIYDIVNNTFTDLGNTATNDKIPYPEGVKQIIKSKADGSIQIGSDEDEITITSEGISIDGDPLITKKANGELHIGKNSWITKEENGRQKVWAKDAAGNSIPIDYTNGTKLLINGRDVEQSINNVGALSAALTGLPTVPKDTTLACGLGTGTHGGDFAFSGGCASKVNEKLSINYAASMTMPGQDYAGKFEDKFSARAGFVWQLGKSTKPTQISLNESKKLKNEVKDLKKQNDQLLARLEKLEKLTLALKLNPDSEVISLANQD